MQIQKDEVRNKIINAATEEFLTLSYNNASMRAIASSACITVGNIYSYFKSKEELFETVVSKAVKQIEDLIFMQISTNDKITKISAGEVTKQIMDAFLSNHKGFLILMNNAKGSKFENIKVVIQMQIKERLIADLIPQLNVNVEYEILADTLSIVLLDGIINIVLKSGDDQELMNKLICDFLLLVFGDIADRI